MVLMKGGRAFHLWHPRKAKDFFPNSDLTLGTWMPPDAAALVLWRWMSVFRTKREARYCGAQPVTHLAIQQALALMPMLATQAHSAWQWLMRPCACQGWCEQHSSAGAQAGHSLPVCRIPTQYLIPTQYIWLFVLWEFCWEKCGFREVTLQWSAIRTILTWWHWLVLHTVCSWVLAQSISRYPQ